MSVQLHHVVDGPTEVDEADAAVLVLVGSLGSTLEMWRPNVETLARRHRVVRLDHRGHGGSPVPDGDYTVADLAGDVLATLDTLGIDRFHLCGLSLGGMVAQYLGSEHPDRVRTLTLCCTSSHFPDSTPWAERRATVTTSGTGSIAETIASRWFTPEWGAAHPDAVAEAAAMITATSDVGYAGCCAALAGWDHRDRLGSVTAPTLVIGAEHDLSTPIEPHTLTLVGAIPGARLEVLPAAHLATIERADDATRLILEHIGA
ncbi:3-oxoadipate enol-lactonase [Pseudonocardia sulfidoxydans NBRC 16205]|uniref:3-oxoadipate enol-lactonase n=1 Tax=Pseudonocardia sulfidoxydans NBRC 16205 TaxID=1223511 RepID=A0A511DGX6_9PSEU|nr:3-oxoadipate enol-lactonase [Pseudonocardia sulfidoxydans]GEL23004.1 3-oxoadipate enol-lactonase [Pseudonocardia sulfidoxydans NBRC 16205]